MLATGFLDVLDAIFTYVFAVGIPLLIGIFGLVCAVGFFALLPKNPDASFFFGTCVICVIYFFIWYADMCEGGLEDALWSSVVAAMVMGVCIIIAKALRLWGIPNIFIFIVYLGIAIFGA